MGAKRTCHSALCLMRDCLRGSVGWMLQQLQKSQHIEPNELMFAWPTPIDNTAKRTQRMLKESTELLVNFFRKVLYRPSPLPS